MSQLTVREAPRILGKQLVRLLSGGDEIEAQDGENIAFMDSRQVIRRGNLVVLASVVAMGVAAFAPLDSAVVAHGEIVVQTHRKSIQHLEGGTVRQVLVQDGQSVKAGQPLVLLDDVLARANLALLRGQADSLAAQVARLQAERDGASHIVFPADLLARRSDPSVAAAIAGEENTFRARTSSVSQQVGVLDQRTEENSRTIDGLRSQGKALQTQAALIQEELSGVEKLYDRGYVPVSRLLALRRQAADLEGQEGQIAGRIAQIEAGNGENRLQGLSLRGQKLSDVVRDLRDAETKRFDVLDRLRAAEDTLARTTLSAPVSGIVVGLAVHTAGQVIKPGDTVMEVVPDHDVLEVQARIRPEDADHVHPGMKARINFSSYRQRRLPMVMGQVKTVSADRLLDDKGQPYFGVDVSVDADALKGYPDGKLIPGMPSEVELDTGVRTPLSYILGPITDVLRRGMREQ